jgi:hypothetical protein
MARTTRGQIRLRAAKNKADSLRNTRKCCSANYPKGAGRTISPKKQVNQCPPVGLVRIAKLR